MQKSKDSLKACFENVNISYCNKTSILKVDMVYLQIKVQPTDIKIKNKKRRIDRRKTDMKKKKEDTERRKTDYQIMMINMQTGERTETGMKTEKNLKRENMKGSLVYPFI